MKDYIKKDSVIELIEGLDIRNLTNGFLSELNKLKERIRNEKEELKVLFISGPIMPAVVANLTGRFIENFNKDNKNKIRVVRYLADSTENDKFVFGAYTG